MAKYQDKPGDGITPDDIDETARILGLKPPEKPKGSNAPPNEADDVAATARMLGIEMHDRPAVVETPSKPNVPQIVVRPIRKSGTAGDQVVEGMPIIGPAFQHGLAALTATLDPVAKIVTPNNPNLAEMPPTWGGRYDRNLGDLRAASKEYSEANPVTSLVSNLAGGGMAMGPVASTKLGGLLMGTRGPTLGSKMITGGVGGGAIGATDAALRGENVQSGGVIGTLAGTAGPMIGQAAHSATNWFLNTFAPRTGILKDISPTAVTKLVNAVDGETPASMRAAKERMGPAGFVGDTNPAFTDIAGGIADTPGPGKAIVRGAYQGRADDQAARLDKALTKSMGISTDIEKFKNFIAENRKAAADPLYEQWRTMQVQPTPELKAMIPRLEAAGAFNMAEELSGISGNPINKTFFTTGATKTFPTTESWDYVKRGLDRRVDQAYRAGDKTLARELINLKGELIDEIEKTAAGKVWKQARTEFAERSALLDQIEAGRDTFLGGRSGLSLDELKAELSHLKGPELAARVVGLRAAADEVMGATLNGDTSLRNKILAPNNRKKMEFLLGKDKADNLVKTMGQERYLGNQYQNVVGGSQTTPKKERVNALQAPPLMPWDPDLSKPLTLLPPQVREGMRPTNILNAWRGQKYSEAANQLAPLITLPASHPDYATLMRSLRREAARRGVVDRNAGAVGSALGGLIAVPGATTARRQYLPAQ